MNIERIQQALKERKIDGWLLCDFHNRDLISIGVAGLDPTKFTSRRWFYFIPASGEPWKLVSKVERTKLDALPGTKHLYLAWRELHARLKELLAGRRTIAMQYSPLNNIPYVSMVDAGTLELVRASGVEVVSSADLVTIFEAVISKRGYDLHLEAARHLDEIVRAAFERIRASVRGGKGGETECSVQKFILDEFGRRGMHYDDPPIVGVNEHPADPHFEPTAKDDRPFTEGDQVLIDLWARMRDPEGIFADITWCGYAGPTPPEKYVRAFAAVVAARDAGVRFVRERFAAGEKVYGYEVDDAVRGVVVKAGFGDFFIHRTGHSIGGVVHGNGVNIDNLETKDEREIIPGVCFSIEPGIYIDGELGVRTEIDVFVTLGGAVEVTTPFQEKLLLL